MKNKVIFFTGSIVILLLLDGCCACPPVTPRECIDFEDQTVGTQFHVGESFTASGTVIDVVAVGTSDNYAEITPGSQTTASGNDLRPKGVGVQLNLPASAYDVTMNFADFGGTTQFIINGDSFSTSGHTRVIEYDGQNIGGVLVDVTAIQQGNNWYGDALLQGAISSLTIVGQELWIDDICYMQ